MFLAEDGEREVKSRLAALAKSRDAVNLGRIHVECRGYLALTSNADLAQLVASCRCLPARPRLLILDPLRDLHQSEENESGPMSEIMGRLRALRDILRCAVLVVHHTAKRGKDNAGRRAGQNLRGSSAIHGAIDGGIYLQTLKTQTTESGLTVLTNSTQVELKAAQSGAPEFSLSLTIADNPNGEAVSAEWSCSEKGAMSTDTRDRHVETVVRVLREEAEKMPAGREPEGISQSEIRKRAGIGMDNARAALELAREQGRARKGEEGGLGMCGWHRANRGRTPNY